MPSNVPVTYIPPFPPVPFVSLSLNTAIRYSPLPLFVAPHNPHPGCVPYCCVFSPCIFSNRSRTQPPPPPPRTTTPRATTPSAMRFTPNSTTPPWPLIVRSPTPSRPPFFAPRLDRHSSDPHALPACSWPLLHRSPTQLPAPPPPTTTPRGTTPSAWSLTPSTTTTPSAWWRTWSSASTTAPTTCSSRWPCCSCTTSGWCLVIVIHQ